MAQRTQAQEQLRAELAEQQERLDAQGRANKPIGGLAARTKWSGQPRRRTSRKLKAQHTKMGRISAALNPTESFVFQANVP